MHKSEFYKAKTNGRVACRNYNEIVIATNRFFFFSKMSGTLALCENIIESEKRLHNGPLETLATRFIYL